MICSVISIVHFSAQGLPLFHNIDESLNKAKNEEKNILMIFSGSDWCKPCIHLRKNIIETKIFRDYAINNLVILELDFPYSRKNRLSKEQIKHNEKLAEIYNKEGAFPKMILLRSDQRTLGTVQYQKKYDSNDLVRQIKKLSQYE